MTAFLARARAFVSVAALAALTAGSACSSSSTPLPSGDDDAASNTDDASTSPGEDASGPTDAGKPPKDTGANSCGVRVNSGVVFEDASVILCGTACDLKQDTCCVDATGTASCKTGHNGCTGALSAAFQCVEDIDCPTGQVCCGYAANASAGSKCQAVSDNGNKCSPTPTSTQGSVQFCQKSCECKDGSECIPQACQVPGIALPANLTMCGLQSEAPYNCMKR